MKTNHTSKTNPIKKLTPGEHMEIFFIELKWMDASAPVSETLSSYGINGNEAVKAFRKIALIGQGVGYDKFIKT
ncbi:MAG: hypothetical protein GY834_14390 [Bacteroidetes bacterium]|nr:hypothetical protein [Bacteroidota bacterium]